MKRDKQILRVLRAVEEGCQTSQECAAVAGLPVKHASGYLSALGQDGLIERTSGRVRFQPRGRTSIVWRARRR